MARLIIREENSDNLSHDDLNPIVDLLLESGNRLRRPPLSDERPSTRWTIRKGRWYIAFENPLDMALIRERIILPPEVYADEESDEVVDTGSRSYIIGGSYAPALVRRSGSTGRLRLRVFPPLGEPIVAHLVPIVEMLITHGNRVLNPPPSAASGHLMAGEQRWYSSHGGYRIDLRRPIDFELVTSVFDVPKTIDMNKAFDRIDDEITWSGILGPGAVERSGCLGLYRRERRNLGGP